MGGPFSGDLISISTREPFFLQVEAAMGPDGKGRGPLYDAVRRASSRHCWKDLQDQFAASYRMALRVPVAVRYRTIMYENDNGTWRFPAARTLFFPRDYSINFKFAQGGSRFGLRQDPARVKDTTASIVPVRRARGKGAG